ncbi:hypothetical protein MWN33_02410 [Starkeya koreensis]|uniref:Thioesterase domain-containing protein n=1 Tax=Ancylobacter koreensis TaxID=266121 RepID=A0ABT0DHY7_9HYPH|nr:hypothetical protein [Ancylobacter koreensis]MCK0206879.1 hypothetical protein [Ancylobacter koreensis]
MKFARVWALCLTVIAVFAVALAAPAQAQSSKSQQPRVYLLRGLANIFSLGMDDLAAKLNARGIKASVHSYVDWEALSGYAVEQAATGKRPTPVIIIGHSLGADAAIYMGNKVSAAGVPVPLVVTFDPVNMTTASAKIGKVVNYYQAGGSGKPVSGPRVDNIDLTGSGQLSHFNIEKAVDLHNRVIAMIVRPAARPVAAKPKPKPVESTAGADAAASPAAAPTVTPAATPVSAPVPAPAATPASSSSSSAAPASAGTETAAASAASSPAGSGTSN